MDARPLTWNTTGFQPTLSLLTFPKEPPHFTCRDVDVAWSVWMPTRNGERVPSSAGLPQVQALHLQAWDQMEHRLDLRREGFLLGCSVAWLTCPLPTIGLGAHHSSPERLNYYPR